VSKLPYNETRVVTWLDYIRKSNKELEKKLKQTRKLKEANK
jgi:hypothetical protein